MVDNQHEKITGYRDLSDEEIFQMNAVKATEKLVADVVATVKKLPYVDQRNVAIARTAFEDAFMRLVRAIAQPDSPFEK